MSTLPRRHVLLALLVIVVWGSNFVVIHAGIEGVPPIMFAAVRFTVLLLALPFVPRPPVPWRDLAAVGLLMSAGQFCLLYGALAVGMPTGLASLVLQAQVIFSVLLSALVLHEHPSRLQIVGIAVGVVGLVVVGMGRGGAVPVLGFVLCVSASACWAAGNIASRRCRTTSGLGITVWSGAFAPLPLWVMSLALEGPQRIAAAMRHVPPAAIWSTLYTAVLASLFGYGVWNSLLAHHPAVHVVPYTLLVPVVGMTAGFLALGEIPTTASLLGGAVLMAGVAIAVVGPRLRARSPWRTPDPLVPEIR